jgi:LysR family glycine cleavage system transcriptional activator
MNSEFRKLPPLTALSAFESVARHRSITKAAKELFLTHSAVSQRISQLEEHLKTRLLVRSTRGVELTPAGSRYLESVRQALGTLALASQDFRNTAGKVLRISVVPAFASSWLISRLRSFHRLHPNVELDIETSTAMANVKTGEVDVAIRWGNGSWPGIEKIKLFSDELIPVCSPAYLKELGALGSPRDLKRAVLLRHKFQRWKPWFDKARLDSSEPAHGPMFNDSALMIQAAVDNLGVALARRMLVQGLLEQRALVSLFNVSVVVDDAFYVVFTSGALARAEVAAFVQWIESATTEDVSEANNRC